MRIILYCEVYCVALNIIHPILYNTVVTVAMVSKRHANNFTDMGDEWVAFCVQETESERA